MRMGYRENALCELVVVELEWRQMARCLRGTAMTQLASSKCERSRMRRLREEEAVLVDATRYYEDHQGL